MLALYRKYRPQKFSEISGQDHIKITLGNQVATGAVAHAYLFTGARGTGKTTTARIVAKAVNCSGRKEGEGEPCNACKACEDITAGKAVDVIEIDAASNTGVDNVRENIIENVRFSPALLPKKVFIIDEVHMLSASAFNALLKTLEEPPSHALFILATTELHKVPDTIVSRCQRFDFKKISTQGIVECLSDIAKAEKRNVSKEVLTAVARAAEGSVRDAESLLGQVFAITEGDIGEKEASLVLPRSEVALSRRLLEAAFGEDAGGALRAIATIGEEGVDPIRFLDDTISLLRKMLVVSLEKDPAAIQGEFDTETEAAIVALANKVPLSRITAAIELFLQKRQQMKTYDAGLLPLELAAVEMSLGASISQPPATSQQPTAVSPTPPKKNSPQIPPPSGREGQGEGDLKSSIPAVHEVVPPAEVRPRAIDPTPPPVLVQDAKTTIEDVKKEWHTFMRAVGEINHALPFVLNVSAPLRIEGGTIIIGSRYPFHCDRLNAEKHHRIFVEVCEKVFGEALTIRGELSETAPIEGPNEVEPISTPTQTDPALKAVMDALGGGRVVG